MRRRNQRKSKFGYGNLEPRVMLTADLELARNLVVNGDFESDLSGSGDGSFIAFIDGDEAMTQELKIRELMTDFGNIAVVDSTAGQVDSIAQNIRTTAGEDYVISFDLRGTNSDSGNVDTNDVEVFFGDESFGVYRGTRTWQTVTIAVSADSAGSQLEFREASTDSDGRGILIDHVAVANVREFNVRNGSFENFDGDASDGLVQNRNVPFIFAVPNNPGNSIGITPVDGAPDGDHVLNLSKSPSLDRVFSNLRTEANSTYFVTFDIRNSDLAEDARVRVRWNGDFVASFDSTSEWRQAGALVTADSEFTTLFFREDSRDDSGVQIDNIRLFRVSSLASDYTVDLNGVGVGEGNSVDFTENIAAEISNKATLDFTNGDQLISATVRILGYKPTESLSAVTEDTNIAATFDDDTGILRLVGRDSVANYQSVLRSVSFNDSDQDPAEVTREVVVSVTDGTVASERSVVEIAVTSVNDAPDVDEVDNFRIEEGGNQTIDIFATDVDDADAELVYDLAITGETFIFGDELPTISDDGQIILNADTHGDATLTVSVEDPNGAVTEVSFDVNVPFVAPTGEIPSDFVPFSGDRQLSDSLPLARNDIYDSAPEMTIDTNLDYRAIIETDEGDLVLDLFASESPLAVNNFVNLAEDGFYDGVNFHRVIEDFVAQGGDPTGTGFGGPGYQFADELDNGLSFSGVGQLAMANSGPNTNGSQFFITLNENPQFSGQHTIFGEIIEGEDVLFNLNISNTDDPSVIQRVRIEIV